MVTHSDDREIIEYLGHQIAVTKDWTFRIGGEGETPIWKDSFKEAKAYIDVAVKAAAKTATANLRLEAITEDGTDTVITGVHMGTSHVIASPKSDKYYPRQPWIVMHLAERVSLNKRLGKINELLRKVSIDGKRGWGGRIEPSDYPGIIARLASDHNKAREAATKIAGTLRKE